jgi:hypothetical protein
VLLEDIVIFVHGLLLINYWSWIWCYFEIFFSFFSRSLNNFSNVINSIIGLHFNILISSTLENILHVLSSFISHWKIKRVFFRFHFHLLIEWIHLFHFIDNFFFSLDFLLFGWSHIFFIKLETFGTTETTIESWSN